MVPMHRNPNSAPINLGRSDFDPLGVMANLASFLTNELAVNPPAAHIPAQYASEDGHGGPPLPLDHIQIGLQFGYYEDEWQLFSVSLRDLISDGEYWGEGCMLPFASELRKMADEIEARAAQRDGSPQGQDAQTGLVHDSPVAESDAPKPD